MSTLLQLAGKLAALERQFDQQDAELADARSGLDERDARQEENENQRIAKRRESQIIQLIGQAMALHTRERQPECMDGSLHDVTRQAGPGEWPEGWATALSADGFNILLQVQDKTGQCARISMTGIQAWGLKLRIERQASEVDHNFNHH